MPISNIGLQEIHLDISTKLRQKTFYANEVDTEGRGLHAFLQDNGIKVDGTGVTMQFRYKSFNDGESKVYDFTPIGDPTNGEFEIHYPTEMVRGHGNKLFPCTIVANDLTSELAFENVFVYVNKAEVNTEGIEASNEYSALKKSLDDVLVVQEQLGNITPEQIAQVTTAETGRVTAESGRATAETTRGNSETSRVNAETSRTTAEGLRVTAESSRATAEATRGVELATVKSQLADVGNQLDIAVNAVAGDAEVVLARGGQLTLKNRLDASDTAKANIDFVEIKTDFATTGKNKIDPSKAELNKLLLESTGTVTPLSNYIVTGFIPVKAGEVHTIYPVRVYAIYNKNRAWLSGENTGSNTGQRTITITEDGYVRSSTSLENLYKIQMEAGTAVTVYEPFKILLPKFDLTEEQKIKFKQGSIRVTKSGENFTLISLFEGSKEIKINTIRNGSSNGTFSLVSTYIDNVIVHSTQDDITPIRTFVTVGANHGYTSIVKINKAAHGKTTADLGSIWTDGTTQYVLLKIDGTYLYFGCPYTVTDGMVSTVITMPVANLTHVSGATNTGIVDIAIKESSQLHPSVNNIVADYILDGIKITQDGDYYGNNLKIVESYVVMDYKSIIDYAKANIGTSYNNNNVAGAVKVTNIFNYRKGLKCTVASSLKVLLKTSFMNCGFVQSDPIINTGKPIKRYLDSVIAKSGFDFKAGVTLSTYNASLLFSKYTDLVTAGIPPLCSTDWAYDTNATTKLYGFSMGYIPDKANSKNANRISTADNLWDMRNTLKSYPALFGYKTLLPGEVKNSISFRNYLSPTEAKEATTINIIKDDKDTYIYLMAHKIIVGLEIPLPDDIGKNVTLVQGVNVTPTTDTVDSSGVTVNVNDTYGFAVLKIN